MNIKNYTSVVPAQESIHKIENILILMGATAISKEYKGGKVESIQFAIVLKGTKIPFKLPGKVEPLAKLLIKAKKNPTENQKQLCWKQAERTVWKNVKEMVDLQWTMIQLEQVEFMECFMPYIFSMEKGKTAFELANENGFKQLTQ